MPTGQEIARLDLRKGGKCFEADMEYSFAFTKATPRFDHRLFWGGYLSREA